MLNTISLLVNDLASLPPLPPMFNYHTLWAHLSSDYPTILSWLLFMLFFHSLGFLFHILDVTRTLSHYKHFHATSNNTPTYMQMLPLVLFNQTMLLLPIMLLTTHLGLTYHLQHVQVTTQAVLISFTSVLLIAPFVHELMFYIAHRYILHAPWGFIHLNHALHHSTKTHSAISAMYMSPPDFILEVVIPYIMPLIIICTSRLITHTHAILVLPFGAIGGLYEHSGYNFLPMFSVTDTSTHAFHHRFHNCSFGDGFGSTSVLDPLFSSACVNIYSMDFIRRYVAKGSAKSHVGTDGYTIIRRPPKRAMLKLDEK